MISTVKIKGISKSHNKLKEYQQECDNYILKTINHETHLQEIKKSTLSIFDEERCYINNNESIPRN